MATAVEADSTDRRRSGRVVRKPEVFADEYYENHIAGNLSAKRKRSSAVNGVQDHDELDPDQEASDVDGLGGDGPSDSDDDEVRERRKHKRKQTAGRPAAKRSKTANGVNTTLALRPAGGSARSKAVQKQKARSRPSQLHADGLYAEVFGQGNTADEAAAKWHAGVIKDNVAGIRDLINFIFQCIGCDSRIDDADIEDADNIPSKLGDVLEEYAQQNSAEYPLTSKNKQFTGLKEVLVEFSHAVIHALHNSGLLYDEPLIYENIHVWTATMSGAGYRSFRHTATVIALAMTSALCQLAQTLQKSMADTKTQIESEKKKKSTNKARVKKMEDDMKADEQKMDAIDALLKDAFVTVYVHRYRDVDEKIRVECVTALGTWIVLYRKMFLEGQYLRYLGWVLSDPNAATRLEVVRVLKALFKNRQNVGALRSFTDRFRPRIVEMGSRDTDTSVRAETIELLDRLRNAEYLEPDDVDTIGQLIFDSEPRVRRAVAKFFVSNIDDLYAAGIEEFDEEQYAAALPATDDTDDFLEPCQSWIKYKCLAQTLAAHDQDVEPDDGDEREKEVYGVASPDSRYMLATTSIFPYMEELHNWEALAGYLLYDHSAAPVRPKANDINQAIQGAYRLESGEENILLDVLHNAVKLSLQHTLETAEEKKGKRTNASKDEAQNKQEAAAQHLIQIIPPLLSKYGGAPQAAASILRLEQLLNIDLISDLQSGEASYEKILEDINKQFTTHNDRKVLAEASRALRAVRTYETSQEAVDAKVAEIWTDSKDTLRARLARKNTTTRGTLDRSSLAAVVEVLGRLAQLAAVSDCTESLEDHSSNSGSNKRKSKADNESLLTLLLELLQRGKYDEGTTATFAELEDRLCSSVLTVLSFFFRWKVVGLKNDIANKNIKSLSTGRMTNLALQRANLVEVIQPVIVSRPPLDPVRVTAILTLLDLFTLFATVRYVRPAKGDLDDSILDNLSSLVTNIPTSIVQFVLETHEHMEKRLARRLRKSIALPLEKARRKGRKDGVPAEGDDIAGGDVEDVERAPEDSEDEATESNAESSTDDDQDEVGTTGVKGKERRKQAQLLAEQALCELTSKIVLAIIAGVLDQGARIRQRLNVNRSKLGKNYGQVIAYLDDKKQKKRKSDPTAGQSSGKDDTRTGKMNPSAQRQGLSAPLIDPDDDAEDDDDAAEYQAEEGDEEDLRRRGLDDDAHDSENGGNEDKDGAEGGDDGDDNNSNNNDDDEVMGD